MYEQNEAHGGKVTDLRPYNYLVAELETYYMFTDPPECTTTFQFCLTLDMKSNR